MLQKIKRVIELNLIALGTHGLGTSGKLGLIRSELQGVFNQILGKKSFRYFKEDFKFDNPTMVFTILHYPMEVRSDVLDLANSDIKNVLDVGGNIGQFSITMLNMNPEIERIDSFEPNPEIFKILQSNTKNYDKINIYNYGIGQTSESKIYYEEGKSGKGSLIKANASDDQSAQIIEESIKLVSDPSQLTKMNSYDLIKIDVEGYEYEVIKNIQNIETKYLYVEVSSSFRNKDHSSSQLLTVIMEKWGDFEILSQTVLNKDVPAYDLFLKFEK